MSSNPAMNYESFIRMAFGLKGNNGVMVDRWGDPAQNANTDHFHDSRLSSVKATVSYAMEIFNTAICEEKQIGDNEVFSKFVEDVINAPDLQTIDQLIDDYRNQIIDKYVMINNGVMTIK